MLFIACGAAASSLSGKALVLIVLWFVLVVLLALHSCVPKAARPRRRVMKLLFLAALALSTLLSIVWWEEAAEPIVAFALVAGLMLGPGLACKWLYRRSLKL
jgi:hypothetical protein